MQPSPQPSPASRRGSARHSACATPHASCKTGVLGHKNLISGCLFDQSDAGATGVQPDKPPARLAFSFPHFFWRRKRNGVGCRAETRPPASNQAHRPNKKQQRPHPRLPPAGEGVNAALTPALSRKRERELCSALSAAWGKLLPCFNARAQYPESPPSSPWCTGAADHPARPAHHPLPPAGRAA